MTNEHILWRAVLTRDAAYDDRFVYAVHRTRIFCRPSCPSRRPLRRNVRFYPDAESATRAGFRPCRRCRPTEPREDRNRQRVQRACDYIERHADGRVTLADLARAVGCSVFHLQRVFTAHIGMSPRDYAAWLRIERFKRAARAGEAVSAAMYDAGYGSSSRLYEKGPTRLGMTPAAYRNGASGMTVTYTIQPCALGRVLVAATARGVCAVKLGHDDASLAATLTSEFSGATLTRDDKRLATWTKRILAAVDDVHKATNVPVDIRGTAFQWKVWKALQAIPYGETRSYGEVARAIGQPTASRAVARACATNPVALLIPCHRVVQKNGASGGYHWGVSRKLALLDTERLGTKQQKSG